MKTQQHRKPVHVLLTHWSLYNWNFTVYYTFINNSLKLTIAKILYVKDTPIILNGKL